MSKKSKAKIFPVLKKYGFIIFCIFIKACFFKEKTNSFINQAFENVDKHGTTYASLHKKQ